MPKRIVKCQAILITLLSKQKCIQSAYIKNQPNMKVHLTLDKNSELKMDKTTTLLLSEITLSYNYTLSWVESIPNLLLKVVIIELLKAT